MADSPEWWSSSAHGVRHLPSHFCSLLAEIAGCWFQGSRERPAQCADEALPPLSPFVVGACSCWAGAWVPFVVDLLNIAVILFFAVVAPLITAPRNIQNNMRRGEVSKIPTHPWH